MGWRERRARAQVVDFGSVEVPSGVVGVGDPGFGRFDDLLRVPVPAGRHAVRATAFTHVYEDGRERVFNGSVSLVVAPGERHSREVLREREGDERWTPGELHFVSIDAGACGFANAGHAAAAFAHEGWEDFVDEELARTPMPWAVTLPGGGDLARSSPGWATAATRSSPTTTGRGRCSRCT